MFHDYVCIHRYVCTRYCISIYFSRALAAVEDLVPVVAAGSVPVEAEVVLVPAPVVDLARYEFILYKS